MEDGALLPSPTREKLMPTIPKSKEDESCSSQRGSPKKSTVSRHGSPQKGSPQKQSMQKKTIKQSKHQIFTLILYDHYQLDSIKSTLKSTSMFTCIRLF